MRGTNAGRGCWRRLWLVRSTSTISRTGSASPPRPSGATSSTSPTPRRCAGPMRRHTGGRRPRRTLDQRLAINGPVEASDRPRGPRAHRGWRDPDPRCRSTVTAFGRLLLDRRLRIITNNLALLPCLARRPGIDLVVLGGNLRATSMSTVGPLAIEALQRMTADRAVMSADGVVAGRRPVRGEPRSGRPQIRNDRESRELSCSPCRQVGGRSRWPGRPCRGAGSGHRRGRPQDQRHGLAEAGADLVVAGA